VARPVVDANVLFPARLRDLFMRLAIAGAYRALWSELILDECFRNISRQRPDLDPERLRRTRELMNGAMVDALVVDFGHLIEQFDLPDVDDRHVAAAALAGGAASIVTWNVRDFPITALEPHGLTAVSPDEFAKQLFDEDPEAVLTALVHQADGLRNPPTTFAELLNSLGEAGMTSFVDAVRAAAT
jgi:predicted nucleic acid-binding protein